MTAVSAKRGDTRAKMVVSAARVLRERGAAGVTIDSVLARSGAPRGSVYHHFPHGRNQILAEALQYSGDEITTTIDNSVHLGARALIAGVSSFWERLLIECDFTVGCPVAAAAMGSAADECGLATEAGAILTRWSTAMTNAFVADGFDETEATGLAVMSISAIEGALVMCRSMHSTAPLHHVVEQLQFLIKARQFINNSALPSV